VEAKLLYAAPAWSGFCTAADRSRLNSFLLKLGYRDSDSPDLDSLFSDSDEQLSDRINHNSRHILQQYLGYKTVLIWTTVSAADTSTRHVYARLLNWMTERFYY